jgi:hypothetical protein
LQLGHSSGSHGTANTALAISYFYFLLQRALKEAPETPKCKSSPIYRGLPKQRRAQRNKRHSQNQDRKKNHHQSSQLRTSLIKPLKPLHRIRSLVPILLNSHPVLFADIMLGSVVFL